MNRSHMFHVGVILSSTSAFNWINFNWIYWGNHRKLKFFNGFFKVLKIKFWNLSLFKVFLYFNRGFKYFFFWKIHKLTFWIISIFNISEKLQHKIQKSMIFFPFNHTNSVFPFSSFSCIKIFQIEIYYIFFLCEEIISFHFFHHLQSVWSQRINEHCKLKWEKNILF